ncbi:hypothetical protein ACOSP7_031529 [Xanthoceras sorbifolium]
MKQKFDKYCASLDKTNYLMIIAVMLDLRYKLGYVAFRFESFYGAEQAHSITTRIRAMLEELYLCYKSLNLNVDRGSNIPSFAIDSDFIVFEQLNKNEKYKLRETHLWEIKQNESYVNVEKLSCSCICCKNVSYQITNYIFWIDGEILVQNTQFSRALQRMCLQCKFMSFHHRTPMCIEVVMFFYLQ